MFPWASLTLTTITKVIRIYTSSSHIPCPVMNTAIKMLTTLCRKEKGTRLSIGTEIALTFLVRQCVAVFATCVESPSVKEEVGNSLK